MSSNATQFTIDEFGRIVPFRVELARLEQAAHQLRNRSNRDSGGSKRKYGDLAKNKDVGGSNKSRNSHRFPNLKGVGTLKEVIQVAFEHQPLSPKHTAAVWTRLSQLLKASNHLDHNALHHCQLGHKLDTLFDHTVDD